MQRTVADHLADPRHAVDLHGATRVGEARGGDRLVVRIGIWVGAAGAVARAGFQATTCASLIAYADAACSLIEQGVGPDALDERRIRAAVGGVHPVHHDRAALVARAAGRVFHHVSQERGATT